MTDPLRLAAEFPAATREQWLKLVDGVLKGAPFDKKLVARTYDGLTIAPLHERAADARPVARTAGPWTVMARVDHPDPAVANAEALHELENGATGLTLVFAGAIGAYGYGLDASEATLARVLDGVVLEGIALELDLSPHTRDAGARIAALARARGVAPEATTIRFAFDPLSTRAAAGASPLPWAQSAPVFTGEVAKLMQAGFKGPIAVADGRVVHAAGGTEAQELAFAVAAGVTYLRALESAGHDLDAARRLLSFRLAADADQFLTIAKFRALRLLWARIEAACGLTPAPVHLSAETAWRMMTRRDPWVNMLRTTIAAFAAGIGGADSITVLPHTAALGLPDRFARRIARNSQLVLQEEANLARVADPAAGSGGIEDLTRQLCDTAWTLFQEIEGAGGAPAALEAGLIQEKVAPVRAAREKAVATRRDPLTGTSEFPHLGETPVTVLDVAPVAAAPLTGAVAFAPLAPMRLAAPYEALRDASDRVLAKTGARPKVFLANLGPLAGFTARAMFAKNLFEAGGIEAASNDGFADADGRTDVTRLVAAFKESGSSLACLCGSDEAYAHEAADAAKALAKAGARLVLAGRPGELEDALKQAGVGTFIHVGCDVLAALRQAHASLGIAGG
jgi:methylmalonyl-CoA mutase